MYRDMIFPVSCVTSNLRVKCEASGSVKLILPLPARISIEFDSQRMPRKRKKLAYQKMMVIIAQNGRQFIVRSNLSAFSVARVAVHVRPSRRQRGGSHEANTMMITCRDQRNFECQIGIAQGGTGDRSHNGNDTGMPTDYARQITEVDSPCHKLSCRLEHIYFRLRIVQTICDLEERSDK